VSAVAVTGVTVALYAAAAVAHLIAFRRARRQPGHGGTEPRDLVMVQGGLLIALLSLVTPLSYWSQVYIWVRAMQDVVLAFVAPALIAVGRPWLVLRRPPRTATDRTEAPAPGRTEPPAPDRAEPPAPRRAEPATVLEGNEEAILAGDFGESERVWPKAAWPLLAVVLFNLAWLGWHIPVAFDLVQRNSAVRAAEHACYLGIGIWFWLEVAGPRAGGYWQAPLRRLAMVTATVAGGTILGMALVFGSNVVYPAYYNASHHIMTVLDDQQLSGAVLWMGVLPSLVVAGVALLNSWLNDEERAEQTDTGVLVKHHTTGWPARPRLR
jgi:cytochrome c oxidase assembly factor CtaG